MSTYKSSYSMHLNVHDDMVLAMKHLGETNESFYVARAIRRENKRHLGVDVKELLDRCSEEDLAMLAKEIKKRSL